MKRDPHIYIFGCLILIAIVTFAIGIKSFESSVLGTTTVNATVVPCHIRFLVYPEKRIPAAGNWSELLEIEVYDPNTLTTVFSEQILSTNLGEAVSADCPDGIFLEGAQYDVIIKGLSHLRRRYDAVTFTGVPNIYVNLSSEPRLLAGDTDLPVGDNDVDNDDIDEIILHLYSVTNQRNDLNRDGKVNSLDLGNALTNKGLVGD